MALFKVLHTNQLCIYHFKRWQFDVSVVTTMPLAGSSLENQNEHKSSYIFFHYYSFELQAAYCLSGYAVQSLLVEEPG